MKFFLIINFLLFSYSCKSNRSLSLSECEDLAFKSYKGFPKAMNDIEKYCKDYRLNYSKETCDKAFKDMILNGDASFLKKKYGEKIINCFSDKEIKKFIKTN